MPQIRHPVQYVVHLVGFRHYSALRPSEFFRPAVRTEAPPGRLLDGTPRPATPAAAVEEEEELAAARSRSKRRLKCAPRSYYRQCVLPSRGEGREKGRRQGEVVRAGPRRRCCCCGCRARARFLLLAAVAAAGTAPRGARPGPEGPDKAAG
uniref:ACC2 n=1 Tax=Arundo donax TaxID=35708 RepID=A0A0A9FNZ9_ARUDO